MSYTTRTLLGPTTFGIANGTYDGSSVDFFGNIVEAADYYQGRGSIQTVMINVTNFTGTVELLGSLNAPLNESLWFKTQTFDRANVATTGTFSLSIVGNFVWMKPEIKNFSSGTINSITISY